MMQQVTIGVRDEPPDYRLEIERYWREVQRDERYRINKRIQAIAAYRHGWHVAARGGMLCDCATGDEAAGWQASRDADAAMRAVGVR